MCNECKRDCERRELTAIKEDNECNVVWISRTPRVTCTNNI